MRRGGLLSESFPNQTIFSLDRGAFDRCERLWQTEKRGRAAALHMNRAEFMLVAEEGAAVLRPYKDKRQGEQQGAEVADRS